MLIPLIDTLSEITVHQPIGAMDGDLIEVLSLIAEQAADLHLKVAGVIVYGELQSAFFQDIPDSMHLEEVDHIANVDADLVVIGPTALIPGSIDAVIRRIHEKKPGVAILCATGAFDVQI